MKYTISDHKGKGAVFFIALGEGTVDSDLKIFLPKCKERYLRLHPTAVIPLNHVPISAKEAKQSLDMLCATGRLYYGDHKLLYDRFRPALIKYIIEEMEGDRFRVEPYFMIQQKMVLMEESFFLFPHSCIVKNWLYPIDERLDHCWVIGQVQEWDKKKLAHFLECEQLDPESVPGYTLSRKEQKVQKPEMRITDRLGAFVRLRDLVWEKDLLEAGYQKRGHEYYCPVDRVRQTLQFLLELGWLVRDSQGREVLLQSDVEWAAVWENDAVVVKGKVSFGDKEASIGKAAVSHRNKEPFLSLNDHQVGLMSHDAFASSLGAVLEGEFYGGDIRIAKSRVGLLEGAPEEKVAGILVRPDALPQRAAAGFVGQLRPYQQIAVNWLCDLTEKKRGALLADEMGLGKTVQVLSYLATKQAGGRTLIVMPTSLIFNWADEIRRFLPGCSVRVHHGVDRTKDAVCLVDASIVLTSYALLRIDEELFSQIGWDCVVLDEAGAIKNGSTMTARSVFSLHANMRIALTGTPVENRLEEIGSLFQFLEPTLIESVHTPHLKKLISPYFLRRKKRDVAKDLPEKIEQTCLVEMSEAQENLYSSFLKKFRSGLLQKVSQEGLSRHRMDVLEALLRLRQICCHPALVEEVGDCGGKWEALFDDLDEVVSSGQKVLVFSQFTTVLKLMRQEAERRNWPSLYLDGQTKDRGSLVKAFQEDARYGIFFLSLKAAGVGLNLTAADYVIIYDPWWNDAQEQQAIDRAHRIGKEGCVIAKRYICKGSIEEKISLLKMNKSQLMEGLFEQNSILTEEIISAMLS